MNFGSGCFPADLLLKNACAPPSGSGTYGAYVCSPDSMLDSSKVQAELVGLIRALIYCDFVLP